MINLTFEQWTIVIMLPFAFLGFIIFLKYAVVDFWTYLLTNKLPKYMKKVTQ